MEQKMADSQALSPQGFQEITSPLIEKLFLQSPIILFQWTNQTGWPVEYVSPNVELILGYSTQDFYKKKLPFLDLIHKHDIQRVEKEVKKHSEQEFTDSFDHRPYRIQHKQGHWLWVEDHTIIIRNDQKQITHFLGYIQDISEHHALRLKMLDNEEKLRTIIDHSPIAIATYDKNMDFLMVNSKWATIFLKEQIIGRNHFEIFPETTDRWKIIYQKCLQGYSGNSEGEFYYREDGKTLRISWQIQPWYDNHGSIGGLIHFVQDITKEWNALQEQNKSFMTLTSILENLNAAVYVADLETFDILFANKYLKDRFGPVEGLKCWQALHSDQTGPCEFCNNDKLVSDTGIPTGVINWEHFNKNMGVWYAISDRAIEWPPGKIVRLEIAYDVTEIKNAELSLQESERRYRQIFETNQAVKLIIDKQSYKIIDANRAACVFYGYSHDQLIQMSFFELLDTPSLGEIKRIKDQFTKDRFYLQITQKTKTNASREVEIYSGPLEYENKVMFYAIIHDITDRKIAQIELSKRDQLLLAVSQAAQILLKIDDLDKAIPITLEILGNATEVDCVSIFKNIKDEPENLKAERVYHWISPYMDIQVEKEHILKFDYMNMNMQDWMSTLFGGESIFTSIEDTKSEDTKSEEKNFFTKLGVRSFMILPINTSSSWWGIIGFFVRHGSKKWSAFESEILKSASGILGSALERESILNKLRDLNKNLESKVQKQLEENRKKDHILIAQSRLAGMGEMMGNIAHQWRQPITILSLIFQDIQDSFVYNDLTAEKIQEASHEVKSIVSHLSQTIDDFRDFYNPSKRKISFFIYQDSLSKIVSFVDNRLTSQHVEIIWNMADDVEIIGYPGEYSQVFLNIINNALDAFLERKTLAPRLEIALSKYHDHSLLSISDNAGGIDPAIIDKIFDPYFTTKEKGTGIGLYMSKMIVEQSMSGSLTVETNKNNTIFRIEI